MLIISRRKAAQGEVGVGGRARATRQPLKVSPWPAQQLRKPHF